MTDKFDGQATIKVRFHNKTEYDKFRMEVLKTKWSTDAAPQWEDITIPFHNCEDVEQINRTVIQLLQLGFEVYSCRFKLEKQLAEEEHPPEGDTDGDDDIEDWDIAGMVNDLWKKIKHV